MPEEDKNLGMVAVPEHVSLPLVSLVELGILYDPSVEVACAFRHSAKGLLVVETQEVEDNPTRINSHIRSQFHNFSIPSNAYLPPAVKKSKTGTYLRIIRAKQ